MQRFFGFGLALLIVGAFSGCDKTSKRQALVVGNWKVKQEYGGREISGKVEFRRDGGMTTEALGMRIESTYKFIDDNNILVEMSIGGQKITEKNKIERLTKQEMVLVDPKGGRATFSRIR